MYGGEQMEGSNWRVIKGYGQSLDNFERYLDDYVAREDRRQTIIGIRITVAV